MADKMVVNVPPYVGEYEFDMNAQLLSPREWRWVREISGYLPAGDNSFMKGLEGLDPDLFVSFAVVAMVRAGTIQRDEVMTVAELLRDPPFDGASVTFKSESAEEEDEVDPPSAPETDDSPPSSGDDSSEDLGASPESSEQKSSGIRDWATGSQDSLQPLSRT